MRRGPGGLSGTAYEVLQVTYANGDVERFPEAEDAVFGDRMATTLLVRKGEWNREVTIATLALVNVRKWEWVAAEQPEPARKPICTCPRVDTGAMPGAHTYVLGRPEPDCPFHGEQPEGSDR